MSATAADLRLLGIAMMLVFCTFPAPICCAAAARSAHSQLWVTPNNTDAANAASSDANEEVDLVDWSPAAQTRPVNLTVLRLLCWQPSPTGECSIAADLTRTELAFTFPVNIDCTAERQPPIDALPPPPQYSNISHIALNGCGIAESTHDTTLGVEFIPHPAAVRRLQLRMFRLTGSQLSERTFEHFGQLLALDMSDNLVQDGCLAPGSLSELHALRDLRLGNNNLSVLADAALDAQLELQNLTVDEPQLQLEASFRLPSQLLEFRLRARSFAWLAHWPLNASLEVLSIRDTPIAYANDSHLISSLQSLHRLRTLAAIAANLSDSWPTFAHAELRSLNLSHNRLQWLSEFRLPALVDLDVSHNWLTDIPATVLRPAHNLRRFVAAHNRLERIAAGAFGGCAQLESIDLRENRLRQIGGQLSLQQQQQQQQQQTRLAAVVRIDGNPWSCQWALDMADAQPAQWAQFRYAKVLNEMNMRGLKCRLDASGQLSTGDVDNLDVSSSLTATNRTVTMTTTSQRRHPKDTAMLTLIILVVGVTFLFLLLFLHIRCRRAAAQQPFYRTLPYEHQRRTPHATTAATAGGRTDFVRRELPATDYEAPIRATCVDDEPKNQRRKRRTPADDSGEAAATDAVTAATDDDDTQLQSAAVGDADERVYMEIDEQRLRRPNLRRSPVPTSKAPTPTANHRETPSTASTVAADSLVAALAGSESPPPSPASAKIDARPTTITQMKYASMNNMLFDRSGGAAEDDRMH